MLQIGDRMMIPGARRAATAAAPQVRSPQPRQEPARQAQPSSSRLRRRPRSCSRTGLQRLPLAKSARSPRRGRRRQSATRQRLNSRAATTADRGFRWPVRGRVIAGFGPRPERAAQRRHQRRRAAGHPDPGRRGRRDRLCRQRVEELRQSGADPPRQRLCHRLRPCQRTHGQARRARCGVARSSPAPDRPAAWTRRSFTSRCARAPRRSIRCRSWNSGGST